MRADHGRGRRGPGGFLAGLMLLAAAGALLAAAGAALAQAYPVRPIRVVVPASPATSLDALPRALAQDLGARLSSAVVIENMPGAGGNIAAAHVARAAPDGYTIMLQITSFAINPSLYRKVPYDPVRQFDPIILAAWSAPTMLVVSPALEGVRSVKELVALSRTRGGRLNYASPGYGTPQHIAMELFKRMSGADFTHVPYKTPGDMVKAVLAGDVSAIFASANVAIPQAKAGKLRILAAIGAQRWPLSPEVPTIGEAGYPEFRFDVWFGFLAPAGVAPEIVRRLNAEFAAVLNTASMKELLAKQGLVATTSSPEEFATLIRTDLAHWARVIKETGISVD
ncbi:MAG: tripartite tricarboxylate transporter substrate binding protein [Burkholderiales bacterium]|nr:tripartite tricarboxylate transporter substrate binding protein [Burkholderiales bacterium]